MGNIRDQGDTFVRYLYYLIIGHKKLFACLKRKRVGNLTSNQFICILPFQSPSYTAKNSLINTMQETAFLKHKKVLLNQALSRLIIISTN